MDRLQRNPGLVLAAAVIFLGVSLFISAQISGPAPSSIQNDQAQLREQLVWGCNYEGNPLREVIQSMIREQIHRAKHINPHFFPDIPPHVFHHLVRVQIAAQRRRLQKAAPINCEGLYPPN